MMDIPDKIDRDKKDKIAAMSDDEFAAMIRLATAAMGLSPEMAAMAVGNTDKIRGLLSGMGDDEISKMIAMLGQK